MSEYKCFKCGSTDIGFFFDNMQFWLRCQKCGTAWRPSKIENKTLENFR